ncbi:MAG: type II toxin-antitoxin system prevent-host-death family antitoxin [Terrimicrobiaceae bacterium]
MKTLNVSEAKTHFSSVVEQVEQGEIVLICKRNVPVAKLSAFHPGVPTGKHNTQIGWAKGTGARIHGDLTEPVFQESDWDMLK